MAWRIDEAVEHGEIDNTVEGRTTGRIWLTGRDEPLILSLDGDCWRDLAGTRLHFENPKAKVCPEYLSMDIDQSGIVGDITASRKNKIPKVSDEEFQRLYEAREEIPYEWRNTLYLEWFSEINGRVVIETASYHLTVSPHEWQMDEDAEEAQKLANLNSMRDFMEKIIQRREPEMVPEEDESPLDEDAWEERLKESDRLTDAYQEVLEKYMEDDDNEQKEAFVMGWDNLLEQLADEDEAFSASELSDSFQEDGDDEQSFYASEEEFPEEEQHPLQIEAYELATTAMNLIERDSPPGTPAYELISHLLKVSGKLTILEPESENSQHEPGLVLAILRRCLNWLDEGVGLCQQLIAEEKNEVRRAALAQIYDSMLKIREAIVELRQELK